MLQLKSPNNDYRYNDNPVYNTKTFGHNNNCQHCKINFYRFNNILNNLLYYDCFLGPFNVQLSPKYESQNSQEDLFII